MQEDLRQLEVLLDPYDWFYEVIAEANRYVVYVHYMDASQDAIIPYLFHDKQVVVHFASSITVSADDFINKPEEKQYSPFARVPFVRVSPQDMEWLRGTSQPTLEEEIEGADVPNDNYLCCELDRLEKQCGSNVLESIFYEEHDGKNCVTNLSIKYPEVRQSIHQLYIEYGFNAIYNELESSI